MSDDVGIDNKELLHAAAGVLAFFTVCQLKAGYVWEWNELIDKDERSNS
jgi:hypothetical protein